jgi:hypothetical protein
VKLNDTIEFSNGSSMSTPTWRASYRSLTPKPTERYPEVVDCRWDVTEITNSKVYPYPPLYTLGAGVLVGYKVGVLLELQGRVLVGL